MELLHTPALVLREDIDVGDEHFKKHGLLHSNLSFPKKIIKENAGLEKGDEDGHLHLFSIFYQNSGP